jgi:hypothetical protein
MTFVRLCIRELAERTSNGTQVRLLWRHGTRQVWVEVRERESDRALVIPVRPEWALDAFHHPYAYASVFSVGLTLESPPVSECGPHGVP